MGRTAVLTANYDAAINVGKLERYANLWLLDCEIRQLSPRTIENRRLLIDKLLWFLRNNESTECGLVELKQFLAHVTNGHKDPNGRWGNPARKQEVRPRTVATYFTNLRTLFRYLNDESAIEASPVESMRAPVARYDQVQPFTQDQVEAILQAARRSRHRRRDEAIVLFLFDTGVRASELCGIKVDDLDMDNRRCKILGKGNKHRSVCLGRKATKALWQYLSEEPHDERGHLFASDRGTKAGEALTRSGLRQLIRRLGRVAGVQSARCSPHTFRHAFAVEFLRAGGNVFTLKELLGHTSLTIVNRYVAFAQADIENQHRQFSPADRLGAKKS